MNINALLVTVVLVLVTKYLFELLKDIKTIAAITIILLLAIEGIYANKKEIIN